MAKNDDSENDVKPEVTLGRLERLARLMRAANHGDGLNPAQWEALRYLSKANRFSNSPGALTQFLGATKGTISQTVKALERKGHISKASRPNERRSIVLTLTDKGKAALAHDPLDNLLKAIGDLGGKTQRRLDRGLASLLADQALRQDAPSFGSCSHCRFFREKGATDQSGGPHACMFYEQPIAAHETGLICISHTEV